MHNFGCDTAPRGGGDQQGSRPLCQQCGKIGHVASRCFKTIKKDFRGLENDGRNSDRQASVAVHGGQGSDHGGSSHDGGQGDGGHTPSYTIDNRWYADSGATDHLTSELDRLSVKERYGGTNKVHTVNGSGMHIHHVGHCTIPNSSRSLQLRDVLKVPTFTRNLMSVPKFARDNNVLFEFHPWLFFCQGPENEGNNP
jgi:hypothetical protein